MEEETAVLIPRLLTLFLVIFGFAELVSVLYTGVLFFELAFGLVWILTLLFTLYTMVDLYLGNNAYSV